jgi:hypothetical protein
MENINNDQIERLLEDISSIKAVINRNRPVLKQVFLPGRFRWFMLLAGVSVIGFSMLFFFLMQYYGGFAAIPAAVRYIIYAGIVADLCFMQIWKLRRFSVSVKTVDRRLTLGWLLKEFYASRIAHLWVPLIVLILLFCIYFLINDLPQFIVPTVSIGYGLLSNFVGTLLDIRYSLVVGYWFLISGILAIIFSSIPIPIALSITIGCGLLVFSLSGFFSLELKEAE